ncbi:hypothetical protein Tco_1182636 [Tanacetum coccineum]
MQRRPALAIGTPSLSFECIPIVLSRCKRARFRHRARIGMKDEAKNVPHLRGQKLSRQAKASKPGTCKWEPAGKENRGQLDDARYASEGLVQSERFPMLSLLRKIRVKDQGTKQTPQEGFGSTQRTGSLIELPFEVIRVIILTKIGYPLEEDKKEETQHRQLPLPE